MHFDPEITQMARDPLLGAGFLKPKLGVAVKVPPQFGQMIQHSVPRALQPSVTSAGAQSGTKSDWKPPEIGASATHRCFGRQVSLPPDVRTELREDRSAVDIDIRAGDERRFVRGQVDRQVRYIL